MPLCIIFPSFHLVSYMFVDIIFSSDANVNCYFGMDSLQFFSNTGKLMQACNAHGLYCVPLYDTLGMQFPFCSMGFI